MGFLTEFIDKALLLYQNLVIRHNDDGLQAFFDPKKFLWTKEFEDCAGCIRSEFQSTLKRSQIASFVSISNSQKKIADLKWKVFFFKIYGWKIPESKDHCPETYRLIEKNRKIRTAFFSILEPGARLKAHVGPFKGVLRFHLGLIVPSDKALCAIRVGDEIRTWREGESLVFDDTFEHEAWNETDQSRVVLFIDFDRPMGTGLDLLNRVLLSAMKYLHPHVHEARRNYRRLAAYLAFPGSY
jgi:ornithine lipid ester-linked acyl 2-hydroxylase